MAVGDSGRASGGGAPAYPRPAEAAGEVGKHVHRGAPEATVGGPGATKAAGAAQEGSDGSAPYGRGDT
jgi:hypothetical protein